MTSEFPVVSETFVVDHVVGLAHRGWTPIVVCDRVHAERLADVRARAGVPIAVETLTPLSSAPRLAPGRVAELIASVARFPRLLALPTGVDAFVRAAALAQAIHRARAEVVHAHFGPNGLAAAIALRGRLPLVVDFHGFDFTAFPRAAGWQPYRETLRSATIVVHSAFARDAVRAGLGVDVCTVTLGADAALFSGRPRGERWNVPLRLLTVGRLVREKGHDVAIFAVEALRHAVQVELRIVGDGPVRPELERLVQALGAGDVVRFAGAVPHARVAEEMAAADVLLVPSTVGADGWVEAFGRVVVEGLASGLPIVASALGGLPEVVGDAGLLVPPNDPAAIAERVRALVTEETPARCAARSRARSSQYSLGRMWDEYDAVAGSAAGR